MLIHQENLIRLVASSAPVAVMRRAVELVNKVKILPVEAKQ
jgi:hypothetical protein